jgi:hypothetical protein
VVWPELITSWGFVKWAGGALSSSTLQLKKRAPPFAAGQISSQNWG